MSSQRWTPWWPAPQWRRRFRQRLLRWYGRHRRVLPWRQDPSPYRVWVSEVMLQQTQVQTVIPYFERFMATFPTVHHLACASQQQVLKLWQGLGYYRRARQLHQAAREIVHRFGGKFPEELEAWLSLPGVGRYTAGAVLSIAMGQCVPILEANTKRLLSRLSLCPHEPESSPGQRYLWQLAQLLLPRRNPGEFNQAMMELGSLVCRPRQPLCKQCPVQQLCQARALDQVDRFPVLGSRAENLHREELVLAVEKGNKLLIVRRQEGQWWSGLWDLLRWQLPSDSAHQEFLLRRLAQTLNAQPVQLHREFASWYTVTRHRVRQHVYRVQVSRGTRVQNPQGRWIPKGQLSQLPWPAPTLRVLTRLGYLS